MSQPLTHDDWRGTTGGLPWMQRALVRWLAIADRRTAYAAMALALPFYVLLGRRGRRAQYSYFRRRLGEPWWRAAAHVVANHYRFGQVVVDRFAAYAGQRFRFTFDGLDDWQAMQQADGGAVLASAHVGNYELAGYLLHTERKPIHALVYLGETPTVMTERRRLFGQSGITMVPVMADMSHIFELNTALADGHLVSIPGDRMFGSRKGIDTLVMGTPVRLPVGPFQLAVARRSPMAAIFVMKADWQTYHIVVRPLRAASPDSAGPADRQRLMQHYADQYADALGEVMRDWPDQWFNYYDFWGDERTDERPSGRAPWCVPVGELLPQRPPFVMVSRLMHIGATLTCTQYDITPGSVFCGPDGLTAAGIVEHIAQTCAARIGYINRYLLHHAMQAGVIGSVTGLDIRRRPRAGETLVTRAEILSTAFGLSSVRAEVRTTAGELIAEGSMKVAERTEPIQPEA